MTNMNFSVTFQRSPTICAGGSQRAPQFSNSFEKVISWATRRFECSRLSSWQLQMKAVWYLLPGFSSAHRWSLCASLCANKRGGILMHHCPSCITASQCRIETHGHQNQWAVQMSPLPLWLGFWCLKDSSVTLMKAARHPSVSQASAAVLTNSPS